MEIIKGVEVIDLALWFRQFNTLLISDTHLGYEEALNRSGVYVTREMYKEMMGEMDVSFARSCRGVS